MDRELKFRTWDGEKMHILENSGLQYYDFEGSYSLGFTVDGYSAFWAHEQYENMSRKANKFPIMQYTGLEDKNGTEIYEGDIVSRGIITFSRGKFQGTYLDGNGDLAEDWEDDLYQERDLEVLGNIYENPELLKQE